jgi:glutathione-specific gamma-glutamylcyclotransferase
VVVFMTVEPNPDRQRFAVTASGFTRDRLKDGSMLEAFRAAAPPGSKLRSDAELEASLSEMLLGQHENEDVYVFAYGSLMWNPALHYVESVRADLRGWSRRFCIRLYMGRGTPEEPGLMLALDRGGICRGLAFRIAAGQVREELSLLWRREMLAGSYVARWVTITMNGLPHRALTFVVNRHHERYASNLTAEQAVEYISKGKGSLGSCAAYFQTTLDTLHSLGIKDASMERLRRALAERPALSR